VPLALQDDPADRVRFEAGLPLQVFSCWNGATVLDAAAFLPPHGLRFRQSRADADPRLGGAPRNATMQASECFLSSVDLWKMGMGRIGIVPQARCVCLCAAVVRALIRRLQRRVHGGSV
jgi:alpha-1,3-mannosyltransferase